MMARAILVSTSAFVVTWSAAAQPTYTLLGDLPGGGVSSWGAGVSPDGAFVVGRATTAQGSEAFIWNAQDGMVGLGDLPGDPHFGIAYAVAADGSVVCGISAVDVGIFHPFRWTEAGGMQDLGVLGDPGNGGGGSANGISADALIIAGTTSTDIGIEAFRWTEVTGMVGLGQLGAGGGFGGGSVSDDGTVIVGTSASMAYRWTEAEGMVALGGLPGGDGVGDARDVNVDGTIIVGRSQSADGIEAFRWTDGIGMESLGDLPGGETDSDAHATNDDGSIILCSGEARPFEVTPCVWTPDTGMIAFDDYLMSLGMDLDGWSFLGSAITPDGRYIVGSATNERESQAVIIDLTPACPADVNGDGKPQRPRLRRLPAALAGRRPGRRLRRQRRLQRAGFRLLSDSVPGGLFMIIHAVAISTLLNIGDCGADLGDQLSRLIADDGEVQDGLGWSVAIDGDTVLAGAINANVHDANSGAAYVFDVSDPDEPVQMHKLYPDEGNANDFFGIASAMAGDIAAISATGDDELGENAGAVYLFDIRSGRQLSKLYASDGGAGQSFGLSLSLHAGVLGVGGSGVVYLFDISDPMDPIEIDKLEPVDGAVANSFGRAIALGESCMVIGAPNDQEGGASAGAVYLVKAGRQSKLIPEDVAPGDEFGWSVAIHASTAAIGTRIGHPDPGKAYLFDVRTEAKLHTLLGPPGENFGDAIAIDGTSAVVGAYTNADNGNQAGAAYVFDVATGRELTKLLAENGEDNDWLGRAISMSGGVAAVGARHHDGNAGNSGAVFTFVAGCPCSADVNGDGNLNVLDFVAFQLLWQASDPGADCDGNAEFNVLDFICFQQVFQGGCP